MLSRRIKTPARILMRVGLNADTNWGSIHIFTLNLPAYDHRKSLYLFICSLIYSINILLFLGYRAHTYFVRFILTILYVGALVSGTFFLNSSCLLLAYRNTIHSLSAMLALGCLFVEFLQVQFSESFYQERVFSSDKHVFCIYRGPGRGCLLFPPGR